MDALASALLLAAFILFVDLTFGEGNHRAALLGGLFSNGSSFGWPTGVQDLGLPAMVQHASIAGKIETDEGALGDQAIAIIPVEILCL